MSNYVRSDSAASPARTATTARAVRRAAFTFLAIEFLDELVDGSRQAAWPLIRLDLGLSYTEIGLLLAVPNLVGNLVEPPLGLLGDTRHRRAIILSGGAGFVLSLALVALSYNFAFLLLAFALFNPSSGAFVSLSQAALMDSAPARREQNMARWAFAGSLGIVAGSLAVNATIAAGASWRVWFGVLAVVSVLLVLTVRRFIFDAPDATAAAAVVMAPRPEPVSIKQGALDALRALRRGEVRRWLALLEFSDLMLDGFHGFLALYFVDVVGTTEARAGMAIAVWTGVGLGGDLLLIPLLERVRGLSYLRWSAGVMLCLFPAFLLAPNLPGKLVLLGLIGITNAGWYSILKAQLYASMPERSGAVLALNNLAGLVGVFVPFALGLFAEHFGLGRMMWLLLAAPLALLCAIPRREKSFQT
jgi:FSR family fosmidomycin resistance protein-like MFS transporter